MTTIKAIIKTALHWEKHSQRFYQNAATKAEDEQIKKLFQKLAGQEKIHVQRLKEYEATANQKIHEEIPWLQTDDIQTYKMNKQQEIKEILEYAMQKEHEAQTKYRKLAETIKEPDAKKLLKNLAQAENGHYHLLKTKHNQLNTNL